MTGVVAAGMSDFPNVSISHIQAALPVLQRMGVPLYIHAELVDDRQPQVGPVKLLQLAAWHGLKLLGTTWQNTAFALVCIAELCAC